MDDLDSSFSTVHLTSDSLSDDTSDDLIDDHVQMKSNDHNCCTCSCSNPAPREARKSTDGNILSSPKKSKPNFDLELRAIDYSEDLNRKQMHNRATYMEFDKPVVNRTMKSSRTGQAKQHVRSSPVKNKVNKKNSDALVSPKKEALQNENTLVKDFGMTFPTPCASNENKKSQGVQTTPRNNGTTKYGDRQIKTSAGVERGTDDIGVISIPLSGKIDNRKSPRRSCHGVFTPETSDQELARRKQGKKS